MQSRVTECHGHSVFAVNFVAYEEWTDKWERLHYSPHIVANVSKPVGYIYVIHVQLWSKANSLMVLMTLKKTIDVFIRYSYGQKNTSSLMKHPK